MKLTDIVGTEDQIKSFATAIRDATPYGFEEIVKAVEREKHLREVARREQQSQRVVKGHEIDELRAFIDQLFDRVKALENPKDSIAKASNYM